MTVSGAVGNPGRLYYIAVQVSVGGIVFDFEILHRNSRSFCFETLQEIDFPFAMGRPLPRINSS